MNIDEFTPIEFKKSTLLSGVTEVVCAFPSKKVIAISRNKIFFKVGIFDRLMQLTKIITTNRGVYWRMFILSARV